MRPVAAVDGAVGSVAELVGDLARSPCSLARDLRGLLHLDGAVWVLGCQVLLLAGDFVLALSQSHGGVEELAAQVRRRPGGLA